MKVKRKYRKELNTNYNNNDSSAITDDQVTERALVTDAGGQGRTIMAFNDHDSGWKCTPGQRSGLLSSLGRI